METLEILILRQKIFSKLIREKYGMAKARIIANSLFELVDPNGKCIKRRTNDSFWKNLLFAHSW